MAGEIGDRTSVFLAPVKAGQQAQPKASSAQPDTKAAPAETYVSQTSDPDVDAQKRLRAMSQQKRVEQPSTTTSARTPPTRDVVRAADGASRLLSEGKGAEASQLLKTEAARARQAAAKLDPRSAEARALLAAADNFDARVKAYGAKNPADSMQAARDLNRSGGRSEELAAELERSGHKDEARLLRGLGNDSRVQAALVAEGAINTDVLMGSAVSQTYRDIVDKSFAQKIGNYGSIKDYITGGRDKLAKDRQKMGVVFNEVEKTMKEKGVSFDRAWNMMFEDNRMVFDGPLRAAGFVSRNDAATFLRDHEVTKNLLSPFADVARGLSNGDAAGAERAQGQIVETLRANGQWEIAKSVLEGYQQNARTADGQAVAARLSGNERGEFWKARAGEFIEKDVPVLLLSGLLSGGVGTLAGGGAMALGSGTRAVRAIQIATELGAFVPTERVLNDAINGKKADWSAGAVGRDYALTVGGYGLFKALGKGWQVLRGPSVGEAARLPIGANDVVLDSNAAIALAKRANGEALQAGEAALLKRLDALGPRNYRIANTTQAEAGQAYQGIKMPVDRSSQEYKDLLQELATNNVGRAKGSADRNIVADVFFAEAEKGVVPTLATHDKGIYNTLLKMSGRDPQKLGKAVPEAFPNGFPVTINGRTIHVLPLPAR